MRISHFLGSLLGRRAHPRRGPERLVLDLAAVDRMTAPCPSARARLESELGRRLVRELEWTLGMEGRLVEARRRRGLRDAA